MAEQTHTGMTAAEFSKLPESAEPIELIDGEMIVSPAPKLAHQRLLLKAAILIESLAEGGEVLVAPLDVYLDDDNVVQPDVLRISGPESLCQAGEDGYLHGAPDLAVEILSPSTARRDKTVKFDLYEKHGTREYWMLDPDAAFIEVWRREGERFVKVGIFGPGETFVSQVLGERTVEVSRIFG